MIVRCGRCQIELEVDGPGEFACPSCGTRNAVRAPGGSSLGGLGGGPLGGPLGPELDLGGLRPPAPAPGDEPVLDWLRCPACRFRFVVGEGIEEAPCPSCSEPVAVADENRV